MKVLWLASWYPSKGNALNGDFIQRHAEAVSLFMPVDVIHVSRTEKKANAESGETINNNYPNLKSIIRCYYLPSLFGIDKACSFFFLFFLYKKLIKKYIKENGKPGLIHVHVSLHCAAVALYCKLRYKIPFIITEHASFFLKQSPRQNVLSKLMLQKAFKNASAITVVSKYLGNAIAEYFNMKSFTVIPNVVDTSVFFYKDDKPKNDVPVFLHISTVRPEKNPGQMLEAFSILKHQFNKKFVLQIVSPQHDDLKQLAKDLKIDDSISWMKETTQPGLAKLMQAANAHVLYSKAETFGCVNIEAMACGLPTIVSDIPTFREYLIENITSYFAPANNPGELAMLLNDFIYKQPLPGKNIAEHAAQFNYKNIGQQFVNIYKEVVNLKSSPK